LVGEERLTERYVLESRIAIGGMGGVHVALDERLARRVAIKVLKDELVHDPRFVERFRREARSVAALSHPNVATVYDYGEENGRHFIVMELVEGRDLARVLREEGPLEPERAARIAAGVARALEHAHAAGVIHRDIKPANIMLSPGDRVKVTDFGIARAIGESSLTATGSVMGTAQYISPEQASSEEVSPQSDTYALGIVLFEMLTGTVPFTGDNSLAVAMKHVSERVPAPSERNPNMPEALDQVVAKATKRHPGDRYRSAGDMAGELDAVAVTLEVGGDTAELGPEDETDQTVWPIPGTRYDPEKLGKRVIGVLVGLALVALALLAWRVLSADGGNNGAGSSRRAGALAPGTTAQESSPPPSSPSVSPTSSGVTLEVYAGLKYKDVEKQLKDAGIVVARTDVDDETEKDTIVGQTPEAGTRVQADETVTLIVSTGNPLEDEGEDDDDDEGPGEGKGKAKGHDKEKD
jgi:serine/threonine protein kinase